MYFVRFLGALKNILSYKIRLSRKLQKFVEIRYRDFKEAQITHCLLSFVGLYRNFNG